MIGEFDFENIITDQQDPTLPSNHTKNIELARNFPFTILSTFNFVIFVFVIAIIFMAIQENAEFQKLSLNVSSFSNLFI